MAVNFLHILEREIRGKGFPAGSQKSGVISADRSGTKARRRIQADKKNNAPNPRNFL
jgi:hypothetical protein